MFAFMHHPYLVCILFGMPSLHLFTFLMFFIFLFIILIAQKCNDTMNLINFIHHRDCMSLVFYFTIARVIDHAVTLCCVLAGCQLHHLILFIF